MDLNGYLIIGGTYTVSATVTMTDENATIPTITWSLYNTLGTLSATSTSDGESVTFTASSKGHEYITASAGGVSAEVHIYCYNVSLDGGIKGFYTPTGSSATTVFYACGGGYACDNYKCISWNIYYYSGSYYYLISPDHVTKTGACCHTGCDISSHTYWYY